MAYLKKMFFVFLLALSSVASANASSITAKFQSRFMSIKGTDYHFLTAGDSSKPMVLFLHGFPESAIAWSEQLKYFSKDFYAVAVDLKGYNLSGKPADVAAYGVEAVAHEVAELAKALTDKPITLVGHDWGGAVAWFFAIKHPYQLKNLIIVNGAHPALFFREYHLSDKQYAASDYIRKIRSGEHGVDHYSKDNFKELTSILFENPVGGAKGFFNENMRKAYLDAWKVPGAINGGLNYYKAMNEIPKWIYTGLIPPDVTLGSLKVRGVPTLVLWGEKDIYLEKTVNTGLEKFVDNVRVVYFPQNSHWIIHEIPDTISKYIEDFSKAN